MQDFVSSLEFNNLNDEIKRAMRRTALDMVQTGYLLRCMFEKKLWLAEYSSLDEYLERELGMDYTMANRLIGINRKYSVGGGSMEIEPKWEGFSQSVLIEMLSMPPELEGKVTPDMTVKQVREIKHQARQKNVKMKPDVKGLMDHAYCAGCGAPLDEDSRPLKCPGCGQMQDWEWYMGKYRPGEAQEGPGEFPDEVIEGEYREIDEEAEEVATSQGSGGEGEHDAAWFVRKYVSTMHDEALKLFEICSKEESNADRAEAIQKCIAPYGCHSVSCSEYSFDFHGFAGGMDFRIGTEKIHLKYGRFTVELMVLLKEGQAEKQEKSVPEPKEDTAEQTRKCITGWSRYGICSCCGYGGVQCCNQCEKDCNSRCGWIDEPYTPEEGEGQEQEPAADGLREVRDILEKEKKLLDDYLAVGGIPDRTVFRQKTIVCALAAMVCDLENDGQEDNQEQPELPAMTNNSKREAFINSYVQWPVWVDVPETGERYYRYQFPNGTSFVVKVYFHRCFDYKSEAEKWEDRFSEGWGSEEYYLLEEGKHFRDCRSNRSAVTDFLKDLQKKGK
ncbi:hypothetical protein AALB47_01460 [Lachnospiraceae bacterium 54-11]